MKFLLLISLASITVHFTTAIQCYECHDEERPKSCEAVKQKTRDDPQGDACLSIFLPNGTVGIKGAISTGRAKKMNLTVDGCTAITNDGETVTMCVCTENLCNKWNLISEYPKPIILTASLLPIPENPELKSPPSSAGKSMINFGAFVFVVLAFKI